VDSDTSMPAACTNDVPSVLNSLYVSYDGALDPLGASQVVPYLLGLSAQGIRPTLISWEKPARLHDQSAKATLAARLADGGIRWRPLRYHRRPRVPATLWDIAVGSATIAAEARRARARIIHCRGDVPMLMARLALLTTQTRLLYDIRGFYADERVESGSWRLGGLVDRAVRRAEANNLARADGLVALTRAALPALARRRAQLPPHRVIPTCVDLDRFRPRNRDEQPNHGLAYLGSLGTWYMTAEMVAFARLAAEVTRERISFLTPDLEQARHAGVDESWAHLASVAPDDVPAWLRRVRAVFFFIRPTGAKRASSPTKLGEALATGLPVVTNPGVGDVDELIQRTGVGVLVRGFDDASYRLALEELKTLLADPATAKRCRSVAEEHFALQAGVAAYRELYETLVASTGGSGRAVPAAGVR
jgi:glycosyltransferase involved in cell wall biosynthesis